MFYLTSLTFFITSSIFRGVLFLPIDFPLRELFSLPRETLLFLRIASRYEASLSIYWLYTGARYCGAVTEACYCCVVKLFINGWVTWDTLCDLDLKNFISESLRDPTLSPISPPMSISLSESVTSPTGGTPTVCLRSYASNHAASIGLSFLLLSFPKAMLKRFLFFADSNAMSTNLLVAQCLISLPLAFLYPSLALCPHPLHCVHIYPFSSLRSDRHWISWVFAHPYCRNSFVTPLHMVKARIYKGQVFLFVLCFFLIVQRLRLIVDCSILFITLWSSIIRFVEHFFIECPKPQHMRQVRNERWII